jgi:hypothetical protein
VKRWQVGDKDWKVVGRLNKAELFEMVQERAQEVLEGRIEVDLNAVPFA